MSDRELVARVVEEVASVTLVGHDRYEINSTCIANAVLAALSAAERLRAEVTGEVVEAYDAGILNDYGGGNVEWWQDYIRAELGRAHEFYQSHAADAERRVRAAVRRDAYAHAVDLARGLYQQGFSLNAETWNPKSDYGRGRLDAADRIAEEIAHA